MMKRFCLCLLIAVIVLPAFSQRKERVADRPGLRFGMQLTPTISWFTSDETSLVDPEGAVMGYSFGMITDWFFQENYAIATGVFMNSMGGKLKYNNGMGLQTKNSGIVSPNGELTLRPKYIEVPIGFKFLTKEFWRIKFVGECGYNQFFLLNAKISKADDASLESKDISDEFSSVVAAYHFGFGVEYALGGDAYLTGGVNATLGLNDVTKSTTQVDGINVDPSNKLNGINFKIGIIF